MPISICAYFLDYLSLWCVSGHLHVLYWSSWSFQWKFSCCKWSKFLLKYFMSCLCSDTPSAIWLCNFLQCYLLVYILCCWCYFQQKIAFLYGCDLRAKMIQDIAFITITITVAVVVLSWVGCLISNFSWIMLYLVVQWQKTLKIYLFSFIKSFIQFTFVTWQADHKLSYALKHCNPQSEANIRFGSGVPCVCIAFAWSEVLVGCM